MSTNTNMFKREEEHVKKLSALKFTSIRQLLEINNKVSCDYNCNKCLIEKICYSEEMTIALKIDLSIKRIFNLFKGAWKR